RSGGIPIAALMRPPDEGSGETARSATWVERARAAASRGPLGHHTHWGGPGQARPKGDGAGDRVREEGAWLREQGLRPTLFCGGNWYTDTDVLEAVADLGYADCTATSYRPRHLAGGALRLQLDEPTWLELPSGSRVLELPTTRSLGMAVRASLAPQEERVLHLYFHDTDLLDRRRAVALEAALRILGRRRAPTDLDRFAEQEAGRAPALPCAQAVAA
ncbi:MAG: hypothetical protein ACXWYS_09575, partial [Gaiellaceae bacterium]